MFGVLWEYAPRLVFWVHDGKELDLVTTTSPQRQAAVRPIVEGIQRDPTFSGAALRTLELAGDPSVKVEQLSHAIVADAALLARVQKLASSPICGFDRRVASFEHAVALLGFGAVRSVCAAAGLMGLFRVPNCGRWFSTRAFWLHSLTTATAGKLINDRVRAAPSDQVLLGGLIHDVGHLVLAQARPDEFCRMLEMIEFDENGVPSQDMRDVELDIFGADHCDFGAALCEAWKLPDCYTLAAAHHHTPLQVSVFSKLPGVVHVADLLACHWVPGFRGDLLGTDVTPDVVKMLGLRQKDLEDINNELKDLLPDIHWMLT